jgi:hypothetical protein
MMARQATFATFIKNERARLDKARKDAVANRAAIDKDLASIERELAALDAYRQAKGDKAIRAPKQAPKRAVRRASGRRGAKRQAVLDCIQQHPDGLSRGEILATMGVKGNRSAEQSVSNALSALKKSARVNSRQGKYFSA